MWGKETKKVEKKKKENMEKFFLSQLSYCSHYLREANKLQISSWLKISFLSAWQVTTGINGLCALYTVVPSNWHLNVQQVSQIKPLIRSYMLEVVNLEPSPTRLPVIFLSISRGKTRSLAVSLSRELLCSLINK